MPLKPQRRTLSPNEGDAALAIPVLLGYIPVVGSSVASIYTLYKTPLPSIISLAVYSLLLVGVGILFGKEPYQLSTGKDRTNLYTAGLVVLSVLGYAMPLIFHWIGMGNTFSIGIAVVCFGLSLLFLGVIGLMVSVSWISYGARWLKWIVASR